MEGASPLWKDRLRPVNELLAIDGLDEDMVEELRKRAKDALTTKALAKEESFEGVSLPKNCSISPASAVK